MTIDMEKAVPADGEFDDVGRDLVVRTDDDIMLRPGAELVPVGQRVQTLVVRARQATARGWVSVVDQPAVIRTGAVVKQSPRAVGRLAKGTPRGAKRAALLLDGWLRDPESIELMTKCADLGDAVGYEKAATAREKKNLPGRRRLVLVAVAFALVIGLAWWAPQVFSGVLAGAVLVGGGALALHGMRGKELVVALLLVVGLAMVAWNTGPWLAAYIPQPPPWLWWVLGGGLTVLFGLLGRKPDQKLVEMPASMAPTRAPDITAPMIVEALFRIGVAGMTTTAADKGMRDEVQVRAPGVGRALHGWQIELELPPGITAGDVGEKREELAGALRRPLGCIWPSGGGDHPGHLRIYIGDKPMATAKQTPWPLADGFPIDIFNPFPLFTDEEGRWIDVTVLGTHAVVAGASGFGKSVTLRQLAVACALDPRVRLYVFDGKISGDLAPLQKVAHCYYEGGEPDDIAEQLAALQGIETEMRRRARFLRDLPPDERSPKVTSLLANQYGHLSPIVLLIDECQEYTEYGVKGSKEDKTIRDAFIATLTRISRLGRSAGIAMVLVSQKPDANVIPTSIMGNCAIRVCHKVTEQNHNDQVLGTSAYKNGYNAALFSQSDRGLAWLRAEGDPRVVRSWSAMVDLEVAEELTDKAYAMRKSRGLLTGQAADDDVVDAEVVIDVVEDVERVMSLFSRRTAHLIELVRWLVELRPEHYTGLDVDELGKRLRNLDVAVRQVKVGGKTTSGVRVADLRKRSSGDGSDLANLDPE